MFFVCLVYEVFMTQSCAINEKSSKIIPKLLFAYRVVYSIKEAMTIKFVRFHIVSLAPFVP